MADWTELTVPLSERVEFASREWAAEADRYLQAKAAAAGSALDGLSCSLTERWQNSPPHLGWKDNVAGFSLRIEDGRIEVGVGPAPEADVEIDGDYNAILPIAWTIYGGDASIRERAQREYGALMGDKKISRKGALPEHPGLMQVLGGLHDHMARRTINNPDIEHRIEHYGLSSNVAELNDQGYTILENAFTDEMADELRAETDRNHDAQPAEDGWKAAQLVTRGRIWEETVVHPWVLTLAEHMLGRGCTVGITETIRKYAGDDTHPGLHTDYSAWRVPEPFPEHCLESTAVWAIDDFSAEAGPTVFLPGSWKRGTHAPRGSNREDCVLLEMPKGSIAFWHGASWHGSQMRTLPGARHSLHIAYLHFMMRTVDRYDTIDPQIVDRNSPPFQTLCGLDDIFGKTVASKGADRERSAYAASANYGSAAPLAR